MGFGTRLISEAEKTAISRDCKYASLDRHDFQAVNFYKKHDYEIICTIPNLAPGFKKHKMFKKLSILGIPLNQIDIKQKIGFSPYAPASS